MYLRIALELYLKRLIAGGYEKVFEMGRVFRNEGLDTRHNPEFTMLEAYEALADYHDMMELTEQMVAAAAIAANGTTVIQIDGQPVDLAPPWRRATMYELIKEHLDIDIHPSMPLEEARRIATEAGVEFEDSWGSGKICDEIYDGGVEHLLVGPIFVCDHPRETSPLARAHRDDPTLVERFEVVVAARELANAYSELTDPVDQRTRFEAEARAKAAGDLEAGDVDEDYLRAMELGMPPTGGLGVGVDRLVMLLAGAPSIREVILFPTLRPEEGSTSEAAPALEGSISAIIARDDAPAVAPTVPHSEARPQDRVVLPPPSRGRPQRRLVLAVLAALAGLATALVGLPGVHSRFGGRFDTVADFDIRAGGMVASVIIGFICLLVAGQLARGKESAWWVAVVGLSAATVAHLLKGPHPVAMLLTIGVLVALVWCKDDFRAPADPPSLWTAVRFVPIWLGVVLVYGFLALFVERDHLSPDLTFTGALDTIFSGLVGLDGPYTYERRLFGEFFPDSLIALGIVGLLIFAFLIFRPLADRQHREPGRPRARRGPRAPSTAGTRWPTSRCATTRASSSRPTARRSSPTPTSRATPWRRATRSARPSRSRW